MAAASWGGHAQPAAASTIGLGLVERQLQAVQRVVAVGALRSVAIGFC
jgi:hypothetical protein